MDNFIVILIFLLFLVTVYLGFKIFFKKKRSPKIGASVLLEKIKKVAKFITVQGEFSEIVDYQDSKYNLLNLLSFEKKALIIVKAQALIGFDLTKIKVVADKRKNTLIVKHFPRAEILSIDTDIQYYDIKQTTFNRFSADAYTELNRKAKETISQKVMQSELPKIAERQIMESLSVLDEITATIGWNIKYHHLALEKPIDKGSKT